uniref:S-arrestin n=1 Tax=Hippocampus comes TaxID=109280 RepID=A0A3Q2XXI5_HIPCM
MGRRDFVDRVDSVDPVAPSGGDSSLWRPLVFVTLSCTFRYGRDDMDVMGVAFRRELYLSTRQVYPPLQDREQGVHTRMQAKLLRKLGDDAYPFFFEVSRTPPSPQTPPCVSSPQQCAVEFEVKAFSAESQDAKIRKRSSVKLTIRKVQYAPEAQEDAAVEISRDFSVSDKPLHVTARLDKEVGGGGLWPVAGRAVTMVINNSTRNVKNMVISVDQVATVVLYSNDSYVKCVAIEEGETVSAGATLQKDILLLPLLANNRERRGIALDGKLKHEDTNLASSSIIKPGVLKEVLGIMVSYRVSINLSVSLCDSEVSLELPFKLMHPKPDTGEDHASHLLLLKNIKKHSTHLTNSSSRLSVPATSQGKVICFFCLFVLFCFLK